MVKVVSKRKISHGPLKVSEWNQANLMSSGFFHMVQGPNGAEYDQAILEKVAKGKSIDPKSKN